MSDTALTFLCLVCGYFALSMLGVEAFELLTEVVDLIAGVWK